MSIKILWQCFCELATGFAFALLLIQLGVIGNNSQLEQIVSNGNEVVITPQAPTGKK
mgnify:CR=1 FL=1